MEGDSVTLHTNLTEILNDDTILWLFGPKESFTAQIRRKDELTSFSVTDDMSFRGRLQVNENTGSLTIRNTRIRHSGLYKLSISREKTMTKIFNVTVSDMVGETEAVKSESVTEGESVTLHTDAEMHKDALMLWRFGDKGVILAKIDTEAKTFTLNNTDEKFRDRLHLSQNGSLTITNTRTTDSGLYELQIRGSESSQRFLLSVTAKDPGLSSGDIAGISLGVLVPVLLVAAAFALLYYRRRISKLKGQMAVTCEEKKETVMEGKSVTLKTSLTQIQSTAMIQWCYEAEDNLIAEINGGNRRTLPGADGRFSSKLMLNEITGDLTINNIRTIHSGLYRLKITGSRGTIYSLTVNVSSMSVKAGDLALLPTAATIQPGDLILWTFGAENSLVVKTDLRTTDINERFRDRLELNNTTGSLTIKNMRPTDSGHFKLQIINKEHTTFSRFNVTVTDSSADRVDGPATVNLPLLNEDFSDGENEQQSSV
ncbi:uncharacterized protein LOC120475659 isoform X2 [Pimephales promelas]|nr:uncharacterized protein LOC120475659 isoform X2 [Pimephales promelas]